VEGFGLRVTGKEREAGLFLRFLSGDDINAVID